LELAIVLLGLVAAGWAALVRRMRKQRKRLRDMRGSALW